MIILLVREEIPVAKISAELLQYKPKSNFTLLRSRLHSVSPIRELEVISNNKPPNSFSKAVYSQNQWLTERTRVGLSITVIDVHDHEVGQVIWHLPVINGRSFCNHCIFPTEVTPVISLIILANVEIFPFQRSMSLINIDEQWTLGCTINHYYSLLLLCQPVVLYPTNRLSRYFQHKTEICDILSMDFQILNR